MSAPYLPAQLKNDDGGCGLTESTKLPENRPLDLVWGAAAIGAVINRTPKQTFHLLENNQLPARKSGGKWVASRRLLRDHFEAGFSAE